MGVYSINYRIPFSIVGFPSASVGSCGATSILSPKRKNKRKSGIHSLSKVSDLQLIEKNLDDSSNTFSLAQYKLPRK